MASDDQRPGAVPGGPGRRTVIAALGATALTEALRTGAAPPAAAEPGPALPAPAAHWTFEEGRGTTAADSSGHGRTLTLRGGAAWGDGHTGHGLALAGRACATAAGPAVDTAHGFTLTARVRLTATDGFHTAVALDGTAVSACYLQLRDDTRAFAFTRLPRDAADANGAAVIAGAGFAPEAGRWYHLAGVADAAAGLLRLYVDGVLEGEVPAPGGWRATGATTVGRGLFGGAEADHFQGGIDDVRCYDTALSGAQIARLAGVPERDTTPLLTIDARRPGPTVPSRLGGIFFEDINHSGEGGLYAELVSNRSFMADPRAPLHWSALGGATIALDPTAPLNEALTRSLRITVRGPGSGAANDGYWGIPVRPATTYRASYFAKADGHTGPLTLALTGTDGTVYARTAAPAPGRDWRRYDLTLRTPPTAPATMEARLTVTTAGTTGTTGTLWLTQVSLFPPTYRNRPNGLRPDLMAALAALRPAFLRFPGGNYLEGNVIADRFDWKKTIGPVERRPGHRNSAWGYWSTDGLGLPEYLQMAEDLDCEPVLCVYAGYSLKGEHVTGEALRPFVQDALDQIEYITGPATSPGAPGAPPTATPRRTRSRTWRSATRTGSTPPARTRSATRPSTTRSPGRTRTSSSSPPPPSAAAPTTSSTSTTTAHPPPSRPGPTSTTGATAPPQGLRGRVGGPGGTPHPQPAGRARRRRLAHRHPPQQRPRGDVVLRAPVQPRPRQHLGHQPDRVRRPDQLPLAQLLRATTAALPPGRHRAAHRSPRPARPERRHHPRPPDRTAVRRRRQHRRHTAHHVGTHRRHPDH